VQRLYHLFVQRLYHLFVQRLYHLFVQRLYHLFVRRLYHLFVQRLYQLCLTCILLPTSMPAGVGHSGVRAYIRWVAGFRRYASPPLLPLSRHSSKLHETLPGRPLKEEDAKVKITANVHEATTKNNF